MKVALALALVLSGAVGALADPQEFARKVLGRSLAPHANVVCFARAYDFAHLARHPRQNVTRVALRAEVDAADPASFTLALGLRLRSEPKWRTTYAYCRATGEAGESSIVCGADCEGGKVDIRLKDDGTAWLQFPGHGAIWSQTDAGDPPKPSGLGADDLLFRLDRTNLTACAPVAEVK